MNLDSCSKVRMRSKATCILWFLLAVSLFSCNGTKYLSGSEKFYDGAEIKFEGSVEIGRKRLYRELIEIPKPTPNLKVLGMRPPVWFYYTTKEPNKKKMLDITL